ncbi:SRPBCC family protein [Rhodococcus zopfii]|uniref:SRPBCC family protein n=1 Tax=Rhodococcus zopfii TaxID=43772 RepID=UPI0014875E57|nr:SRPBCC family protein [Rhodococcus zopfii]
MSTARIPRSGHVDAVVDASPEQVWAVLSDVTRIGEWSSECLGAEWLGGAPGPVVGARFRGRNRVGLLRWNRVCTVTEASAPHTFAYRTRGAITRDATAWTLRLERVGDRTRITMTNQVLAMPRVFELVVVNLIPAHRDRSGKLAADLVRLGNVARSGAADRAPSADSRGQRRR